MYVGWVKTCLLPGRVATVVDLAAAFQGIWHGVVAVAATRAPVGLKFIFAGCCGVTRLRKATYCAF